MHVCLFGRQRSSYIAHENNNKQTKERKKNASFPAERVLHDDEKVKWECTYCEGSGVLAGDRGDGLEDKDGEGHSRGPVLVEEQAEDTNSDRQCSPETAAEDLEDTDGNSEEDAEEPGNLDEGGGVALDEDKVSVGEREGEGKGGEGKDDKGVVGEEGV